MVFFDEIEPLEDVLVYDEVGFLHLTGGQTNGKLILTQMRLVFVTGGGFFGSKQKTEHAINMSSIDGATLEPAENLGVILRIDFTISIGSYTARYHCRLAQAQKMVDIINQGIDGGVLR